MKYCEERTNKKMDYTQDVENTAAKPKLHPNPGKWLDNNRVLAWPR